MSLQSYTISVPATLYDAVVQRAKTEKRSVESWVERTLVRHLPPIEGDFSAEFTAELNAMPYLTDTTLWQLARAVLPKSHNTQLWTLNDVAKERPLTPDETAKRNTLLQTESENMTRRARAAVLLQARGYDMSDPAVLRDE